ncbi:gluconokinase [Vagococcus carniphilus]|uniref:gluconokinase n=2 Tax=Vagococcus carniphilus TaxID=218144 RepID=UPI003BAC1664
MYRLAIDVGTTNIKFNIFENYKIKESLEMRVDTYYGDLGKVYQSPERILQQIKRGIKNLTQKGYEIEEVIFSTAMHSIMPIFEEPREEELLIWSDRQAKDFVKTFKQEEKALEFYKKTGTPIHEMSPLMKIAHFKNKGWFSDVKEWIGLKEYLVEAFTGKKVVDYSTASATGLFNIHTKKWDEEILDFAGITQNQLAKLVDTDVYYPITKKQAEAVFLSEEVKVYVGASDGCLASYACYLANGTVNTLTVGTSGAVRKLTKEIELDDEGQTFCYYLTKDYWVVGGASNNGGQVLEWANKMFYSDKTIYKELDHIIKEAPIGSNGIQFLPYITGERAPLWDGDIEGSFSGLTLANKKEDLLRSIIEGVFFNLRLIGDLVSLEPRDVSVSGGLFEEPILTTLAADIFGKNCIQSHYSEPNFGSICLIEKPTSYILSEHKRVFFNEENHKLYNKSYARFAKTVKTELSTKK